MATLLIKQGTLKVSDQLISVNEDPTITGKAKKLLSDSGATLNSAGPSSPVELLGLKQVPSAGSVFTTPENLPQIEKLLKKNQDSPEPKPEPTPDPKPEPEPDKTKESSKPEKPDDPNESADETEEEEPEEKPTIKIILKADTKGTLEAIKQNLSEEVILIQHSAGQVNEADVLLAQSTGSVIIAFHVPVSKSAKKLAEIEQVPVRTYDIIYKLLEDFESEVLKMLEPTIDERELGTAKVKAIFNIKQEVIAGCIVTKGKISLGDTIHLRRNNKIITDSKIASLKQGKVEVKQVEADSECGLVLKPELNVQEADHIVAFKKSE